MEGMRAPIETEAEYALEFPVQCGKCGSWIDKIVVVRLLRTKINFTSALPRRGRVIVCSQCSAIISAELGGLS